MLMFQDDHKLPSYLPSGFLAELTIKLPEYFMP